MLYNHQTSNPNHQTRGKLNIWGVVVSERWVALMNGDMDKNTPADRNPRSRFAAFLKKLAFHLSQKLTESPKNLPKRGLNFRGVLRFAAAKRKLYHPFPALFFTSFRSQRQFAAPHPAGARHSATAKTLHKRGDVGCMKACAQCYNEAVLAGVLTMARGAITKQPWRVCLPWSVVLYRSSFSGCAYHGQACALHYNEEVRRVCLAWSGVHAVL